MKKLLLIALALCLTTAITVARPHNPAGTSADTANKIQKADDYNNLKPNFKNTTDDATAPVNGKAGSTSARAKMDYQNLNSNYGKANTAPATGSRR